MLQYIQISSSQTNYFLSYRAYRHTDTQTERQTPTNTGTQTHADEYSIVAVGKPQLLKLKTLIFY